MSNNINADWADQQYQIQLDKMAGVDEEIVVKFEDIDPDSYKDNLEDR
jgi:hypothetical protein